MNFQRVSAFVLSLMVLFSSFGFTVSTHLCGGEKIMSAVGFVKTDLTCGMKKRATSCPNKDEIQSTCCQNIHEYHHIEDNVSKEKTEIFIPDFAPVFFDIGLTPLFDLALNQTYFNDFSPPLIVKDFRVALQTFLI